MMTSDEEQPHMEQQPFVMYTACDGNRKPHEAHCWVDNREGLTWRCRGRDKHGRYNVMPLRNFPAGLSGSRQYGWVTGQDARTPDV